jgi:hypothetical protein
MPRGGTDVVRRSLFGAGTPTPGAGQPDTGEERRRKAKPNQNGGSSKRPSTADGQSQHRSPNGDAAPAWPTAIRRRSVERTAVTVPTDLLMRVKDAVAVLNGWPHQYTMARFVEEAFTAQLERLKVELNGGREFPETNRKIRTGRPPGT